MKLTDKELTFIKTIRKSADRCKHGHTLLSHPNCFPVQSQDKVCFFDLEFMGQKADWGIILCWVIGDEAGGEWWGVLKDIRKTDATIVQNCVKKLQEFDVVVGHCSSWIDVPYLRTRALINKVSFPKHGELRQLDLWRVCKYKYSFAKNSQVALSLAARGKTRKSSVEGYAWCEAAFYNNKVKQQQILEHCKNDIKDLRENYLAVKEQIGKVRQYI